MKKAKTEINMDAIHLKVMKDWEQEHKKQEKEAVKHFNAAMVLEKRIDDAVHGKLGQVSGSEGDAWGMEARHHWVEALHCFMMFECQIKDFKKGAYNKAFELTLWNIRMAAGLENDAIVQGWPKEKAKLWKQFAKTPLKVA